MRNANAEESTAAESVGRIAHKVFLDETEFIQRFLLHVLPPGFMRIRHFGLRSNRKKELLEKARALLGLRAELPPREKKSTRELMLQFTGIDITRCPRCKTGMLIFRAKLNPLALDSS